MRITSLILLLLTGILPSFAQEEGVFRSDGKIMVVVSLLLIIFFGIVIYLIRLERKIKKLEK